MISKEQNRIDMAFDRNQKANIMTHLINLNKSAETASIAYEIAKKHGEISPELTYATAILMNLGETHDEIKHIYDPFYRWPKEGMDRPDHPINLNKRHGEFSVKMAESFGINLTEEQKQAIEGHSKGEYSTALGQIIKIAEVCRATEDKRIYNGEDKNAATSWEEIEKILLKDTGLSHGIIEVAKEAYVSTRFKNIKPSHDTDDGEISE